MKRTAVFVTLGVGILMMSLMVLAFSPQLRAEGNQGSAMKLRVGDMAPDFKLQYFDGKELKDVSLSEYRGKKNVVLAFYVFAFTGG
jgi:hypothetical protein